MVVGFDVEFTDQFGAWWSTLSERQQHDLDQRVTLLEQQGPALRRPVVGEIVGSSFDPQMKELICDSDGAHLRVLFMFDPRRTAILLIAGDKTGRWKSWYRKMIPVADQLFLDHLQELKNEGLL